MPKNSWVNTNENKYQLHVTIPTIDSTIESENVDNRVVYIGDLEKRKQAYGICGECKEPGTGYKCSNTSYTAQSTSANPISECLDCEIKRIRTK
ncbi:kinase-like domain-containing protein [Rhizophagus irregularis DAOM 181602=DAOM 197198]|nr:kinase-like domain-containing protein [Rhizophagus irregularis DAOM 181602=DAOM 197198]